MRRLLIALAAASALAAPAGRALAWGDTGHRIIGRLGIESLPKDAGLPGFLMSAATADAVEEFAREPDRWRKSGRLHDSDRDAAHFIDLDDQGKTLSGIPMNALPLRRADYQTGLAAAKTDEAKAGYLPYAIADGWQQLVKDFAYWRVEKAAEAHSNDPAHKAWYAADITRRESLIVRDIGVWAHYVGDGSMPLHTTIHFNGWGEFPNPDDFTQQHVHTPWEAFYVIANVRLEDVRSAMKSYQPCATEILSCTEGYLKQSNDLVVPFYKLQKVHAFEGNSKEGLGFTTERVAAGASEVRNLILDAWAASETMSVGYPGVSLKEVESGSIDPWIMIYGDG